MSAQQAVSDARPSPEPGSRLAGVDGLRAFAALWVVLFHIRAFSQAHLLAPLDLFIRSGSTGVSLFLVISGFCLYMPFAGGRHDRFKTGDFLLRRTRRLMPAYYTSLAFFALLYAVGATAFGFVHLGWLQLGWQLVTHATMTHPLFPSTFYTLNGAYWSLGLEWQLYLALPLLVLGVRRFGLRNTAIAAIALNIVYRLVLTMAIDHGVVPRGSLLASAVLPNQLPGRWAEFVFGMIAADLYVTGRLARWTKRLGGRLIFLAPVALVPLSLLAVGNPLSHLLFGSVFFLLLCLVLSSNNPLHRVFSWPPLVAVGIMSYSLYLVHQPIVQAMAYMARVDGRMSPTASFALLVALLPVILLVAWALFYTVERHTLTSRRWSSSGTPGALLVPTHLIQRRTRARHRSADPVRGTAMRRRPLRVLAVQTTTSSTSEVQVLRTLLESLQPTDSAPEVMLVQGVDGADGHDRGRQLVSSYLGIPHVTVYPVNVGRLGQNAGSWLERGMKVGRLLRLRLARRNLAAVAREFNPDIIYSAQQIWDLRIATPLARSLRKPQVVHLHYHCGPWLGRGAINILRRARVVLTVSDFIRADAIANGVLPANVYTLYNGVVTPPGLSQVARRRVREGLRAELSLPADACLVGMTARLASWKGQEHLMDAMLPILQQDGRVHLVLAGSEYPGPNGVSGRIAAVAQRGGVTSQVHLLGHRTDIPRLLEAFDVFAHPSRLEPCSIAILEAMAHGLPIAAWREGGTIELVADQESGLLVEPLDIDGLTAALRTLIGNQGSRLMMGWWARQRAATLFHPDLAATAFQSHLEEAAEVQHQYQPLASMPTAAELATS